jgi:polyisoprenoid-binding protein YceI
MRILTISALSCLLFTANVYADPQFCIDSEHSTVRIHVEPGGLLGGLAHDHQIEARNITGCLEIDWDQLDQASFSVTFSTADIHVLDPKHPSDVQKVQETMESEVLRIHDFPKITFKSQNVQLKRRHPLDTYPLTIEGQLTIVGRTQKATIPVVLNRTGASSAKVTGTYVLKQSDFGITPVKVLGSMVKVKDEVELEFNLQLYQAGTRP